MNESPQLSRLGSSKQTPVIQWLLVLNKTTRYSDRLDNDAYFRQTGIAKVWPYPLTFKTGRMNTETIASFYASVQSGKATGC